MHKVHLMQQMHPTGNRQKTPIGKNSLWAKSTHRQKVPRAKSAGRQNLPSAHSVQFGSVLVLFHSGWVRFWFSSGWDAHFMVAPPQKKPETALLLDLNLHGGIGDLNDVQKGSLLGWRV